jgi:hypothetical protein
MGFLMAEVVYLGVHLPDLMQHVVEVQAIFCQAYPCL